MKPVTQIHHTSLSPCGRGVGESGVSAQTCSPSPQPSPVKGEGGHSGHAYHGGAAIQIGAHIFPASLSFLGRPLTGWSAIGQAPLPSRERGGGEGEHLEGEGKNRFSGR
jgi:hypothetical protein